MTWPDSPLLISCLDPQAAAGLFERMLSETSGQLRSAPDKECCPLFTGSADTVRALLPGCSQMLQPGELLAAVGPVVLAGSEHDDVGGFGGRKRSSRHAFTKNGGLRLPEGCIMAGVTLLPLPWAKKKGRRCVCGP